MKTLNERLDELEKRTSIIERQLHDVGEKSKEMVDSWQEVLLQIVEDFRINYPAVKKLREQEVLLQIVEDFRIDYPAVKKLREQEMFLQIVEDFRIDCPAVKKLRDSVSRDEQIL